MAKRLTYTPAERKQAKSFRNKIYYYRRIKKQLNVISSNVDAAYTSVRNKMQATGSNTTMKRVRNVIHKALTDEEERELYYAGCFEDDDDYKRNDFREVMMRKGIDDSIIEKICSAAGVDSFADWKEWYIQQVESEPGYVNEELLQQRQDQVQQALKAAENAFEGWKANVWNSRQGSNG